MKITSTSMPLGEVISLNAHSNRVSFVASVVAAFGLVVACASEPRTNAEVEEQTSVEDFVRIAGHGVDQDYDSLKGPDDAIRRSDLIVVGWLRNIVDGIDIRYDDPVVTARETNTYATFVVEVRDVVSGDVAVGDEIYVVVPKNTAVTPSQLAAQMPKAEVALVLDDITDWSPTSMAVVERPDTIPAEARFYYAFSDGFWLQGAGDSKMVGMFAAPYELTTEWMGASTIDQFAAQFR